jgi:hypothetical protein
MSIVSLQFMNQNNINFYDSERDKISIRTFIFHETQSKPQTQMNEMNIFRIMSD